MDHSEVDIYLLQDTLDDVKFVSSNDDLLPLVQGPECLEFGLNTRSQTLHAR